VPVDRSSDTETVYLSEADVAVLAGVVGHPYRLPTVRELLFAAGEFEADLLRRRVGRLVEQELLERVEFTDGSPEAGGPETFYGTTEFADDVLRRRLSPERERRLQEEYARVDKPDEIRTLERAPRPPR